MPVFVMEQERFAGRIRLEVGKREEEGLARILGLLRGGAEPGLLERLLRDGFVEFGADFGALVPPPAVFRAPIAEPEGLTLALAALSDDRDYVALWAVEARAAGRPEGPRFRSEALAAAGLVGKTGAEIREWVARRMPDGLRAGRDAVSRWENTGFFTAEAWALAHYGALRPGPFMTVEPDIAETLVAFETFGGVPRRWVGELAARLADIQLRAIFWNEETGESAFGVTDAPGLMAWASSSDPGDLARAISGDFSSPSPGP